MKNEPIPFTSGNGNRYYYDPRLREIFILDPQRYKQCETACKNDSPGPSTFKGLSGKNVEYQLANLQQVTIEMTERCNLNCHYCTYGRLYSTVHRNGKDIPFTYIRNILLFLNEKMSSALNVSNGKPFYVSFYGGEPLLRFNQIKEAVELMETLDFSNNTVTFSMTTNAFFLNKYMDYLVEHGFRLLISLDGDIAGNRLRVDHNEKSQFEKIFANVKQLQTQYPDYFKTNVNFNSVLNTHNSVESITSFIETHFDKLPSIASINPIGLNPDKIADFYKIYASQIESFEDAEKAMDSKDKFFIHHPEVKETFLFLRSVCDNSFRDFNSFLENEKKNRFPTGTCLPFGKRMFISANGLILPCENVAHENAFGKVDENGVHMDLEEVANIYNDAIAKLSNQCSGCYGESICSQCIFQMETRFTCGDVINRKRLQDKFSQAMTFVENNPELYARLMEEVCVE